QKSLGNRFRLHAADEAVAAVRTLRPREHSQIHAASRVVQTAASAFVERWRVGMGAEAAALEAERTARMMAAQDVRTLVSFAGGRPLSPYRGAFAEQTDPAVPLVGYIAVKHMGYWADMFVTGARQRTAPVLSTQAALRAMLKAAGPGVAASALHSAAA